MKCPPNSNRGNGQLPTGGDDEIEARRAAACRAFWSDYPLNGAYRQVVDDWPFTLREFVAFVVATPTDQFWVSRRASE